MDSTSMTILAQAIANIVDKGITIRIQHTYPDRPPKGMSGLEYNQFYKDKINYADTLCSRPEDK